MTAPAQFSWRPIDGRRRSTFTRTCQRLRFAPNVNQQGFDDLLSGYQAEYRPLSPPVSLGGGGGLSGAALWRFHSRWGELLLRAWPQHGPGRTHIERVHRWLSMTAELEFVPVPIRDRAGRSYQERDGVFWEVTPWLAGEPDRATPPSVEHLHRAFAALAAFHQRVACEEVRGFSAGLRQRYLDIRQLIEGGFDVIESAIVRASDSGPDLRPAAWSWLSLARNVGPRVLEPLFGASQHIVRTQPAIRDARPEHFLFDGDRLSGLIDFGAMGVDAVAGDLARLIGEWLDGHASARLEALAAYEQVRPLDPDEVELIDLFESGTALLIGERWVRWHFVEHRHFDHPDAVSRGLRGG